MKRALVLSALIAALVGCSDEVANQGAASDSSSADRPLIERAQTSPPRHSSPGGREGSRTFAPLGRATAPARSLFNTPSAAPKQALKTAFPIAGCEATYGRTHHDYPASDIFAATGCSVVSVTSGVVDEVSRKDIWSSKQNDGATRGGLSVSVVGDDGVRYYYSHFSEITAEIAPGQLVSAGQKIGEVGATGSARGTSPHLHFGLSWPTIKEAWWIRRGVLAPAPYLDAWRAGRDRSPIDDIEELREMQGELPRCEAAC